MTQISDRIDCESGRICLEMFQFQLYPSALLV